METKLLIVSGDGHVSAPPETFAEYIEDRYLDALRELSVENEQVLQISAAMGSYSPEALAVIDRGGVIAGGGLTGAFDIGRRIREMDREGIAAELAVPGTQVSTLPFFSVQNLGAYSVDLRSAGLRAYHRWLAEMIAEGDGRVIGVAEPDPRNVMEESLAGLTWAAEHGYKAVELPGAVGDPDLPPLHDPYYERFWATCADLGLALFVHAGWGHMQGELGLMCAHMATMRDDGAFTEEDRATACAELGIADPLALDMRPRQVMWQLMLGGVFDRYPNLNLILTEVRADWLPATLAYLDFHFEESGRHLQRKPSEYWATNCFAVASSIHRAEVESRHEIGVETMLFGRDYPHPEGTWPNTVDWLRVAFAGVPEADVRLILGENAIRCLGLDHKHLSQVAERIGLSTSDVLGEHHVDPRAVESFNLRGGYNKPIPDFDPAEVDKLFAVDSLSV